MYGLYSFDNFYDDPYLPTPSSQCFPFISFSRGVSLHLSDRNWSAFLDVWIVYS